MAISASDISLVLSGGSGNQAPNSALGGSPSATPVASKGSQQLVRRRNARTSDGRFGRLSVPLLVQRWRTAGLQSQPLD